MSLEETIASYDQLAGEYARRWQDRSAMAPAMERFTASLPPGSLVLDVGCGPGFDCASLARYCMRVLGVDLSWGMLRAGLSTYPGVRIQADMRFLPVAGGVDGIWCNAALLHLTRHDTHLALREFHRVLKTGGIAYLALKEGQGEAQRSDTYGPERPRYFTYWSDDELDRALGASQLRIVARWSDDDGGQRWLSRIVHKT